MVRLSSGRAVTSEGPAASLRDAHREDTRRRILEAVNQLLAEEHPASVSVPAVARRSGVSVPTIYRYFPTKEALLDASATSIDVQTRAWLGGEAPVPGKNLGEFLRRMWSELAENLPALRASQMSGLGKELRKRRTERRHADAVGAMTGAGIDLDTEAGQRVFRMTLVLTSSSVFLEQLDRLELPVEVAAEDVIWAIEALTDTVRAGQTRSASSVGRRRQK